MILSEANIFRERGKSEDLNFSNWNKCKFELEIWLVISAEKELLSISSEYYWKQNYVSIRIY